MREFAPAKINLSLHVTGKREDGYHLLDSLVTFLDIGDEVLAHEDDDITLYLRGPFGTQLSDVALGDNLVVKAAQALRKEAGIAQGVRLELVKNLPIASGIGGGSADAAAALRLLTRFWKLPEKLAADIAPELGSDVPACLMSRPLHLQGVGEILTPLSMTPPGWFVLANPGKSLSTPAVFKEYDGHFSDMPSAKVSGMDVDALLHYLQTLRNDLEPAALRLLPEIQQVLAALLMLPGSRLVRMSGSGATCFSIFAKKEEAERAAAQLRRQYPTWWIAAGGMHANQA